MSEHIQARNTAEAFWTLDPLAVVKPSDPWFADIETLLPRKHYGVAHRLKRSLGDSPARPQFVHLAVMGHAGMGKTTLTRNALAELAGDGVQPIYIDSLQVFDQSAFTFSDVMLIAAEAVLGHLVDNKIEVGGAQLESVRQWFEEVLVISTHREQVFGSVEASAEGGLTVPLVAKIAAKVTAALKSDHEYRKEIRKRADRDPRELIRRVNVLLDSAHAALAPRKARLCVVFDNLEKTDLALIDRALLQRADEFRQLRANTLLFFNPASEYSPIGVQVSKVFTCVGVPALPVRFPGDAPSVVRPEAIKALEFMLSKRVLLDAVFDDPHACVEALAHWSGGHIRDLLLIARRAVESVEPEKVTVADIAYAGRWHGASLTSSLEPGDLSRAVEIHRTHRVLDTKQDRRMLKNSCVLQYNGTQWWDVHPAVRADELFIEAANKAAHE